MPRQSFLLNADLINGLMAERKWTQQELALQTGVDVTRICRYLDLKVPLEERERASLKTLEKLAAKLGYTGKGEHMLLTLKNDGTPYRPNDNETNTLPNVVIDPEPVGITTQVTPNKLVITIAGPEAIIELLKLVQWNEVIRHLVSLAAKAVATKMKKGSIVLSLETDETATKDLIDSFLSWRVQHIGIYEILLISSREYSHDIVQACSSHFRFAATTIEEKCKARLLAGREIRLATGSGVHIVKRTPLNRISAGSDEVGDALGSAIEARALTEDAWDTVNTAGKGSDAAWRAASNAWNKAYRKLGMAAEAVLEVFSGAFRAAANAAIEAADAASDVTATQWDIRASAANASKKAAYDALRAIEEAENNISSHAGYHFWGFSSTLSPWQISDAQHYWTTLNLDDFPQRARFSANESIEPQPAILLDEEAFQDRLYYQPS